MVPPTSSNGEDYQKKLKLYSCYISPPAFSVRIALNLKGLGYESKSVNVLKGEQYRPEFLKINPMGCVPALKDGDMMLGDSSAILLYLEDKYPQNPLLPQDLGKKAINYQAANIVSSSIQPVLRIPVLGYIRDNVGPNERLLWVHKHLGKGFAGYQDQDITMDRFSLHKIGWRSRRCGLESLVSAICEDLQRKALEKLLDNHAGKYATGDEIFLADVFLAPYVIGYPQRYDFDMSGFLLLCRLRDAYMNVPAIQNAMPEKQPDFPV